VINQTQEVVIKIRETANTIEDNLKEIYQKRFDLLAPQGEKSICKEYEEISVMEKLSDSANELMNDPKNFTNKTFKELWNRIKNNQESILRDIQQQATGQDDIISMSIDAIHKQFDNLIDVGNKLTSVNDATTASDMLLQISQISQKVHEVYPDVLSNIHKISDIISLVAHSFMPNIENDYKKIIRIDTDPIYQKKSPGTDRWYPYNLFDEATKRDNGLKRLNKQLDQLDNILSDIKEK
jgi:hypothetical protein